MIVSVTLAWDNGLDRAVMANDRGVVVDTLGSESETS